MYQAKGTADVKAELGRCKRLEEGQGGWRSGGEGGRRGSDREGGGEGMAIGLILRVEFCLKINGRGFPGGK